MASGDNQDSPKYMTYSNSNVPLLGALIDYIETSLNYLSLKTFAHAEVLHAKTTRVTLSASFLTFVCFLLGLTCNVKFEVVTVDEVPLPNDLHLMILSRDDKLYIDDIDVSRVMWCIEASDTVVILISCLLIRNSCYVGTAGFILLKAERLVLVITPALQKTTAKYHYFLGVLYSCRSPLSEYFFLPWLGATLRGLFLRQAPTAGALLYTMAVINGNINPLFLTAFTFLFLLEARLWLEIARLIRSRWEHRRYNSGAEDPEYEIETLWSNDDVQSVEVRNFVY